MNKRTIFHSPRLLSDIRRRPLISSMAVSGMVLTLLAIPTMAQVGGTYRVEILISNGVGITEPQQWADALGRAGCNGIRIRAATTGDRVEIRNSGTESRPDLVVNAQLMADGRLRLPDGAHAISDAKRIVESLEKLANPAQATAAAKTDKDKTPTGNSDTATPHPSVREVLFAQPVGFSTLGMNRAEILKRITDGWRRAGVTPDGLEPVLRTLADQEASEKAKREKYLETLNSIRQRQLAGEMLDTQEELAAVYGEAKNSGGKNGVVPNLPEFESVWEAPEMESCAAGTAATYLLRCGGFALDLNGHSDQQTSITVLRSPTPRDATLHPVGLDPAETGVNRRNAFPRLNEPLNVTRLDQVPATRFLANLSKRLELPILIDYAALRAKKLILDQRPVSLPASESTYRGVITEALKPLGLQPILRLDDAGKPFLWITTGYVRIL